MTLHDLYQKLYDIGLNAVIDEDLEGQLVIYTGLMEKVPGKQLVKFEVDEEDTLD